MGWLLRPNAIYKLVLYNQGIISRNFGCLKQSKGCFHHVNPYNSHVSNQRTASTSSVRDTYIEWLRGITESAPVSGARDGLIAIHDFSGLPWWCTIVLTTLGLRVMVTLPLGIYQTYVIAKLELCKVEFAGLVKELKMETVHAIKQFGWTEKYARNVYNVSAKKQWRLLVERDNCHPLKTSLVLWVQLPVWILLSLALRSMAYGLAADPVLNQNLASELSTEGCLWIQDLLAVDSTGIFPIIVCVSNLAIIELQSSSRKNHTRAQKILTNVFRAFAIVSFPIALTVPSCMSLYWSVSSSLALAQNSLLMSPKFRSVCGVPETPVHQPRPYRHAWENFKEKWRIVKKV